MKRLLGAVLPLGIMALIFYFSAQDVIASTEASTGIGDLIARVINPDYVNMGADQRVAYVYGIDGKVRELAHFGIFMVLAIGVYASAMLLRFSVCWRNVLAVLVTAGYAVIDEVHQYFVPGRAFQVSDIMTDVAGMVLGVIVCNVFAAVYRFSKRARG